MFSGQDLKRGEDFCGSYISLFGRIFLVRSCNTKIMFNGQQLDVMALCRFSLRLLPSQCK